jgi:threonylcarbamoyladenosine tRNA methylthiotransferase MtaB
VAEYHVENFGCRASRADGEVIAAELERLGLQPATDAGSGDVIIANTCSVTAQAERTARAYLRRARRKNPNVRLIVTGCYAQRAPDEVAALPGVHAVVGNSHKALVPEIARDFVPLQTLLVDDTFAHSELAMPPSGWWTRTGQTRPNLKVQDGCANRCSFCIIPTTRGPSRSVSLESVLNQVNEFVAAGGTELVLSGINLGRWGRDLVPQATLAELVASILEQTALPRLRLSSIEPMDWTQELLALFGANDRLARHAHLPLQSGSDAILRAMHRRYRPWHYAEKLAQIRDMMPDAAIGADVMVGFPGETDALYEENFTFIATQPFTYLHLFPFSPRPGTSAWEAAQASSVPQPVVAERMSRLRHLIDERNLSFRQKFLGRVLPAVTLHSQGLGLALSDNFLELRLDAPMAANRNVQVLVTGLTEDGLTGVSF